MLTATIYDVFCDETAAGNPCAVVVLEHWLRDAELLGIAQQLAQPVTTFVVSGADEFGGQHYQVRWFTVVGEINLCGHGSLAAGAALLQAKGLSELTLHSAYGQVQIARKNGLYQLQLPGWSAQPYTITPEVQALGLPLVASFRTRDLVLVLASEQAVLDFQPDMQLIRQIRDVHAVILTAPSGATGYVLRYFTPSSGIDEDSATGSAHCSLAPYWFSKLDRTELQARQLSAKGGFFRLTRLSSEAILIAAQVATQHQQVII